MGSATSILRLCPPWESRPRTMRRTSFGGSQTPTQKIGAPTGSNDVENVMCDCENVT